MSSTEELAQIRNGPNHPFLASLLPAHQLILIVRKQYIFSGMPFKDQIPVATDELHLY